MKKRACCLLLMILFTFGAFGCDSYGFLSDEETHELLTEIKLDFSDGEIWNRDITVLKQKETEKYTVAFIKQTMALLNHDSENLSIYGAWFGSKGYCRICTISGYEPILYEDKAYYIDMLDVAKYRNGSFQITVKYRDQSSDSKECVAQIEIAPS